MTLNLHNDNWRALLFLILIGFIIFAFTFRSCEKPLPIAEPLKDKVYKDIKKGDSLKKEVVKQDSIRVIYKNKFITLWRTLQGDTTYLPCENIIVLADSVIRIDSVEIETLKAVIQNKDTTIKDLFKVVRTDSIEIRGLKKQVKRQKLKTKLVAIGMGALLGASIFVK